MIPSVLIKRAVLLFLALASILAVTLSYSTRASAAEMTLDERVEKFLYYRAVNDCLRHIDLKERNSTEIANGDFWDGGFLAGQGIDKPISAALLTGTADNDGSICRKDDDNFFPEAAAALGFDNPAAMYCAIQPIAGRDNDGSGSNDYERCLNGSGNYDASGSEEQQASQFTAGIKNYATGGSSVPTNPDGAMSYRIYFETFKAFCKVDRVSDYQASRDKSLADSKEYVVVNEVVLKENGNPDIVPALYKVGATRTFPVGAGDHQDYKVYGVWAQPNAGAYNLTCGQLAAKTWEFDEAYGDYLKNNPEEAGVGQGGGNGENEPVCSAGALGWVICPAINFIGEMNDTIYGAVQSMLYIDPVTVKTGGPLYDTWTKFRDLANILFVVVFLVVVFSQATSIGLSSYGVKRILPRILAAAVLVNVSFFICQIALDISNIVGVGIGDLVDSMRSGARLDIDVLSWETAIGAAIVGGGVYAGIGTVLGAGSITAALAMLLPFAITALFAIVTAIAVLIARQVIIILLIALAPLAFIALILPNTQKYFQLWQNTFTVMLVMFPLVSLLFAGSQLAANIVLTSATSSDGISFFALIAAICMMFIPLFGIPYIVKFSGGVIGRVANLVNNPNKGPFDSLKKKTEGYRDYKRDQARIRNGSGEFGSGVGGYMRKNTFGKYSRRRASIDATKQSVKKEGDEAVSGYIAEKAVRDEAFAERMAGGAAYQGSNLGAAMRRVQAAGIAHERDESRKRVAAIQQRLLHDRVEIEKDSATGEVDFTKGMGKVYADAAARGDHETVAAVINQAHKQGSFGRQATAEMITKQAIGSGVDGGISSDEAKAAQFEVQEAIYGLNLPARADITKGAMGSGGTWQLKDVADLGTEQKAALDGGVLRAAINAGKVSQPEAERIVTTNLRDRVENAELVQALERIAYPGGVPPTPPTPPPTPPTPPPTPPPAGGGAGTP